MISIKQKNRKRISLFEYVAFSMQNCCGWTIVYMLLQIISAIFPTLIISVSAAFINAFIENYSKSGNTVQLVRSGGLFLFFVLISYLLPTCISFVGIRLNVNLGTAYDFLLANKRSRIKYALIENSETYELVERVCADSSGRMYKGIRNIFNAAEYIIRFAGITVTLLVYDAAVGLLAGGLLVLIVPICVKGGKEDYKAYEKASEQFRKARYLRTILSGRDSAAERTLFGSANWMNQKWETWHNEGRILAAVATKKNFIRIKIGSMISVLVSGGIMLIMLPDVLNGKISVGLYISIVTAVIGLVQLMTWNIASVVEELVVSRQYIKDYASFMSLEEETQFSEKREKINVSRVEFRDVSFSYPNCDKKVLNHVNFILETGKTYALVGENGSGKSTIVKLMLGLFKDYEGEILINGVELKQFSAWQLQSIYACSFQDFARYELSVRDNIAIGRGIQMDQVSDAAVSEAIDKVGLTNYISAMPKGIETKIGRIEDEGTDLSGGQWQRIAIARALVKDAAVYIMDEPTAALDPMSEKDIYNLIYEAMCGKIGVLITHRLGGAARTDEIIVLKQGKICERGTFKNLMRANGVFAHLYNMQRSWYQ